MENFSTVKEICDYLGWTVSELARRASITWERANFAYGGHKVSLGIKRKIAAAFSAGLDRTIQPGDIDWRESRGNQRDET